MSLFNLYFIIYVQFEVDHSKTEELRDDTFYIHFDVNCILCYVYFLTAVDCDGRSLLNCLTQSKACAYGMTCV